MKLIKLFKSELVLASFLIFIGILLRWFNLEETAFFDADQENFAWTAVRLIYEKRPVLIGLKAGEFPVFIGPLMYYVYAFFLLIFKMDPMGLSYFHWLLSAVTLISIFWVTRKIFNKKTGLVALFLFTFSAFFTNYDQRVWLPGPLILVSIWVFYFLVSLNNKNQVKNLLVLGLLLSLAFQLHLAALFFIPIIILGIFLKKIKLNWRAVSFGSGAGLLGFLPVILFDLRHDFLNLKGWGTLFATTNKHLDYGQRFLNLLRYNLESEVRIFSLPINKITLTLSALFFFYWVIKSLTQKTKQQEIHLAWLWILVPMLIFWPLNLHTPEYYFILSFPILAMLSAVLIIETIKKNIFSKILGLIFLAAFLFFNLRMILFRDIGKAIFLPFKKQAVDFIISQAEETDFSVHYETDYGYSYGYDYLFWWRLGRVPCKDEKAAFEIIVPWNYKNRLLTKRFGGVGVITPNTREP